MYRKRTKSLNKTSDIRVPERIMTESSIKQYIKKLIIIPSRKIIKLQSLVEAYEYVIDGIEYGSVKIKNRKSFHALMFLIHTTTTFSIPLNSIETHYIHKVILCI